VAGSNLQKMGDGIRKIEKERGLKVQLSLDEYTKLLALSPGLADLITGLDLFEMLNS